MLSHYPESFYDFIKPGAKTPAQRRTAQYRAEAAALNAKKRAVAREESSAPTYNHAAVVEGKRLRARTDMAAGGFVR